MGAIDVTAVILAVIGMVSGWVTYWFDRKSIRLRLPAWKLRPKI